MTYEQRLHALAEEMAAGAFERAIQEGVFEMEPWEGFNYRNNWITTHLPFARIAMKHMAEEWKSAYNYFYNFIDEPGVGPDFTEGLQERGLVPVNYEQ
ncbi:hypothetical protein DCC81_12030 [Chitinophaga parva]|uniref:Uncharacterized protein n=1 Tax=Chitinophaga parva TaxID=2169414 RepID=A0A2T7BFI0_9BACT|nr:hypothetical protein [Chitinophaga parva]PUZ25035.1 hypothetical protein DCC81_12030 [Chitinophaga parva]